MKTKNFGLIALLAIGVIALTGCGKTETPVETPTENPNENPANVEPADVEMANPASIYCEEQGGILQLEAGAGLCMFPDGSYCEEWSYFRGECQPGEIIYNTIDDGFIDDIEQKTDWNGSSQKYSNEDLQAAIDTIMNEINNKWTVKVEMKELFYDGDEASIANLDYCKSLNPEITECATFTTNFYIPKQDVQMAGAFEPNTNITGYGWTLGKNSAGEWEILTNGFG